MSPPRDPASAEPAKTWILTGSPENFAATAAHGFTVIGMKERRLNQARQIAIGDRIVFYLTKIQTFAAIAAVESELFEDRAKIWPGKPGKADPYPWRFEISPLIVLDEVDYVDVEPLAGRLEHVRKWPPEHWKLAFQGQLRTIGEADAALIAQTMAEAAGAGVINDAV